ncbi:cytidine deaminase [Erwinia tracheiphila]|uniref:Cytidine deaminase n=1 Tax=Erwinia tracheiphila TaxID=65700 RepID=A0A345CSJ5_9GAMM|nr:cytidine deaminase [Erwinia tracheiphila]AXF76412.1 cytidine deaminase [Erwinia tracheiphila]UIA84925.1 cytidine deaminase [Erwinia tracheiphila]UIA93522.1 cytidine deaminase [Erwinia tracheiphila]
MQSRFQTALASLPPLLQTAVFPFLNANDFPGYFTSGQVSAILSESGLDHRELTFALLPLAAACAVTPLSGFNVGAVALGESGHLWFGANMEFPGATMQQTVHAEQSAVTHAWMRGETRLVAMTINYTPCGHCRQFMNELNSATTLSIHLPGRPPALLVDYLPDTFGPRDLSIHTLLLDPVDHGLVIKGNPLHRAALDAANRSYAPYSQALSGVALQTADGTIFSGSYAENAAFNPSLPPLQTALILLNMSGYDMQDIQRAMLAEEADAKLIQRHATEATLQALGCRDITLIPLR